MKTPVRRWSSVACATDHEGMNRNLMNPFRVLAGPGNGKITVIYSILSPAKRFP